ncbi:hypothetical protein RRG08_042812 [Elysia crispata]|uniref:Uncharacterized protein n=1 Tax=Elysia crispata TaxID=231223 RepID=A0AAE0YCY3_9GAST|nr:hypothetical protein RRG08_042812 [Elysia crispata]
MGLIQAPVRSLLSDPGPQKVGDVMAESEHGSDPSPGEGNYKDRTLDQLVLRTNFKLRNETTSSERGVTATVDFNVGLCLISL